MCLGARPCALAFPLAAIVGGGLKQHAVVGNGGVVAFPGQRAGGGLKHVPIRVVASLLKFPLAAMSGAGEPALTIVFHRAGGGLKRTSRPRRARPCFHVSRPPGSGCRDENAPKRRVMPRFLAIQYVETCPAVGCHAETVSPGSDVGGGLKRFDTRPRSSADRNSNAAD